MEWQNVALAFGLTLFAGLATGIGGALAFFARRTNTTFLSYSLGFSAGVAVSSGTIAVHWCRIGDHGCAGDSAHFDRSRAT